MAKKKKTVWLIALVGGGVALWYFMSQKSPAAALPPSAAASTPAASYSTDIVAVINRLDPVTQTKFTNLLQILSPSQLQMMDSIAHSWNNQIPLTPDQQTFWGTVGVF